MMAQALKRLDDWKAVSRTEDDQQLIARLMLRAALERRESRGAHYRLDYPDPAPGRPVRSFVEPLPDAVEILAGASSQVA